MAPLGDGAGLRYLQDVETVDVGGMVDESAIAVAERRDYMGMGFALEVHLEAMTLI